MLTTHGFALQQLLPCLATESYFSHRVFNTYSINLTLSHSTRVLRLYNTVLAVAAHSGLRSLFGLTKLENVVILTANYGVKQNQFIKSTPKLCIRNFKEFNEIFDRVIREWLL